MKNKKKKEQCSNLKWLCVSACIFLTSHACRTLYIHTYTHTHVHTYTKDCRDSWKKTTVTLTFCKLHKIIFYRCINIRVNVLLFTTVPPNRKTRERGGKRKDTFIHFRRRFFASDRVRLPILDESLYSLRLTRINVVLLYDCFLKEKRFVSGD